MKTHELWRNDVADVDLGLVEDRMERAVREVYNKYLLTDAGTARLVLVLPSIVPLPVISSILTALFERWKYSTITLLPAPTMTAIAAGVRSALVVDIGWEETIITPIYEYKELAASRTTRAMKLLTFKIGEKLAEIAGKHPSSAGNELRQDFEFIEDFISRVVSCEPEAGSSSTDTISVEWPIHTASHTIQVAHAELSQIVADSFFERETKLNHDDNEMALHQLLFRCLLGLPPDVRGICMSRVTLMGPGASIPGLKERVVAELQALINTYGWTAVRGLHVKPTRQGLAEIAQGSAAPPDARHDLSLPFGEDYVEEKLSKLRSKDVHVSSQGTLRSIDSLGAWAGASLLASVKVKSVVEIERERFLSHGISGATRETDSSVVTQRMSSLAVGATKTGDRSSWTLGGWG